MNKKRFVYYIMCLFVLFGFFHCTPTEKVEDPLQSEELRITIEEAHKVLGLENVVFIDVRSIADWSDSSRKIKGAVRHLYKDFDSWADQYEPAQKIILYCS